MPDHVITGLMLVIGIIHLLPLSGFPSARRIAALYGLHDMSADLEILLRHRAVLFGLLGLFILYAAFNPVYLPLAFVGAAVSLGTFFFLALTVGGYGRSIQTILVADYVAAACLALAVLLHVLYS